MIRFRGVYPCYDDSIILTGCENGIMPNITYESIKIPHRPGIISASKTHDERAIKLTFELCGHTAERNARLGAALAHWAESENDAQFVFDEQPDRFYLARLTSASPVDYAAESPEVELVFTCANPYGFSVKPLSALVGETIFYNGNVATWPTLTYTADKAITSARWSDGKGVIQLDYDIPKGHEIIIDNANRLITDNGTPVMQHLSLYSDWLRLERGVNTITGTGGTVSWREVYL